MTKYVVVLRADGRFPFSIDPIEPRQVVDHAGAMGHHKRTSIRSNERHPGRNRGASLARRGATSLHQHLKPCRLALTNNALCYPVTKIARSVTIHLTWPSFVKMRTLVVLFSASQDQIHFNCQNTVQ